MEIADTVPHPPTLAGVSTALWSQQEVARRLESQSGSWRTVRDALLGCCAGCALFGAALGAYAMTFQQILASALKVPLLLLGTTVLCFPVLFVLQAVFEKQPLSLARVATMQALALAATGVLWGAFAPPLLFLVISTAQYKLAQVLALLIGTVGGATGLGRFLWSYRSVCEIEPLQGLVLTVYSVLFAAVGSQLAWVLRPFVGDPSLPFELFRRLGGNMFSHIGAMLAG